VIGESGDPFEIALAGGSFEALGFTGALAGGELGADVTAETPAPLGTFGADGTSNASAGTLPSSAQSDIPFFQTNDAAEMRPTLSASSNSSVDITATSSPPTLTR
jgi:hypothetical protein